MCDGPGSLPSRDCQRWPACVVRFGFLGLIIWGCEMAEEQGFRVGEYTIRPSGYTNVVIEGDHDGGQSATPEQWLRGGLKSGPLTEPIEWIPVTERLPEIGADPHACTSREVLVSGIAEGERYAYVGHLFKHPDGKLVFCDSTDGEDYPGVTHWAELMKGPKG
jgi:hypothetical protein